MSRLSNVHVSAKAQRQGALGCGRKVASVSEQRRIKTRRRPSRRRINRRRPSRRRINRRRHSRRRIKRSGGPPVLAQGGQDRRGHARCIQTKLRKDGGGL